MYLDIYLISTYGEKVISKVSFNSLVPGLKAQFQSCEIASAAYFMDWFEKGKNVQLFTLLIIQRSQQVVGFTIGKFYYASLERFAQVLMIIE